MSMWWNGRHACLRCMWRELWGFKSPRRQIKKILTNVSIFFIMKLGRTRITFWGFSEFYVRVKSSDSERTRVCEDKDLRQRSEANHLSERQ